MEKDQKINTDKQNEDVNETSINDKTIDAIKIYRTRKEIKEITAEEKIKDLEDKLQNFCRNGESKKKV